MTFSDDRRRSLLSGCARGRVLEPAFVFRYDSLGYQYCPVTSLHKAYPAFFGPAMSVRSTGEVDIAITWWAADPVTTSPTPPPEIRRPSGLGQRSDSFCSDGSLGSIRHAVVVGIGHERPGHYRRPSASEPNPFGSSARHTPGPVPAYRLCVREPDHVHVRDSVGFCVVVIHLFVRSHLMTRPYRPRPEDADPTDKPKLSRFPVTLVRSVTNVRSYYLSDTPS